MSGQAFGLFQILPGGRLPSDLPEGTFDTYLNPRMREALDTPLIPATERPAMAFKTDFRPPRWEISSDHRPPGSINAALHELPVTREHLAGIENKVLLLPRLGVVGIVIEPRSGGAHFRVLQPNPDLPAYPANCALWVSDWELYRAVDMHIVPWTSHTNVEYGLRPKGSGEDATRWMDQVSWFGAREMALEAAEVLDDYDPVLLTRTTHIGGVVTCEVIYPKNPLESR